MIENFTSNPNVNISLNPEDFVLVRGVNNSEILGQVSIDSSCVYLSLTDVELSRVLIHSKLLIKRIGSLSEIIKTYPKTFISVKDELNDPKNSAAKKYHSDSLFPIKVLYRVIVNCSLNNGIENKLEIEKNMALSIEEALQEEVLISDMHFMLSQYIFNRPRSEMEI